jgi:signal transduction histidine kinase
MLAYKGLSVFSAMGANQATQLWIVARLQLAVAVVLPCLAVAGRLRPGWALIGFSALGVVGSGLVFAGLFPDCYVEGQGLTPFKVAAEIASLAVMGLTAGFIHRDAYPRDGRVRRLILAMLWLNVGAGLAFTIYVDVYGLLNMAGHVMVVLGNLALYAAVVWEGLSKPQATLYARLNQAKDRMADIAVRATGDIDDFAYVLAHHLQEPLRAQYTYAQRLERVLPAPLSAEAKEALDFLRAGALRQRALLRDVQRYLTIGRGAEIRGSCAATAAASAALRGLGARLEAADGLVDLDGELPTVAMDAFHLEELFTVLLDNAISYAREGVPPRVRVSAQRDGRMAEFAVTDNGVGVPEEFRERVFKVFERLGPDGGTDNASTGTGIGLALARKIVEAAHGRIWIDAAPDGGAMVRFTLPLAR